MRKEKEPIESGSLSVRQKGKSAKGQEGMPRSTTSLQNAKAKMKFDFPAPLGPKKTLNFVAFGALVPFREATWVGKREDRSGVKSKETLFRYDRQFSTENERSMILSR